MHKPDPAHSVTIAPLHRRILAMVYDGLLLLAILFCTTMLYMTVVVILTGPSPEFLNAQEGDVITQLEPVPVGWLIYPIWAFVYAGFYSYFWRTSGQTLGMQAWKIKIEDSQGYSPTLQQCLLRLLAGIPSLLLAGIGYWVLLLPGNRGAWLDRASKTRVVFVGAPKKSNTN